MDGLEPFRKAVSELERIQATMNSLAKKGEWRRELIDLRRELQTQISEVAIALSNCRLLDANDKLARNVGQALSDMRTTLALHQARWPAVAIDSSNLEYLESIAAVRTANRAFIDLGREFLSGGAKPTNRSRGSDE